MCYDWLGLFLGGLWCYSGQVMSWYLHTDFPPLDPDPPHNFTATPLSPSTVKFTWEPPKGSMNEIFILDCAPQPYQFPRSTRDTMLKAGHFIPNTNYICTMFTAHTANIENSTTTVQFKTRAWKNITVDTCMQDHSASTPCLQAIIYLEGHWRS